MREINPERGSRRVHLGGGPGHPRGSRPLPGRDLQGPFRAVSKHYMLSFTAKIPAFSPSPLTPSRQGRGSTFKAVIQAFSPPLALPVAHT